MTKILAEALFLKAANGAVDYVETTIVEFDVPNGDPAIISYGGPAYAGSYSYSFDATTTALGQTRSDGIIIAPDELKVLT